MHRAAIVINDRQLTVQHAGKMWRMGWVIRHLCSLWFWDRVHATSSPPLWPSLQMRAVDLPSAIAINPVQCPRDVSIRRVVSSLPLLLFVHAQSFIQSSALTHCLLSSLKKGCGIGNTVTVFSNIVTITKWNMSLILTILAYTSDPKVV